MAINIKPEQWMYLGRWKEPVLSAHFWDHWADGEAIKKITRIKCNSNRISLDGNFYCWKRTYNSIKKESCSATKSRNFNYFYNFKRVTTKVVRDLLAIEKRYSLKNFVSIKNLKEYFSKLHELVGAWFIIFPISEGIEEYLKQKLLKSKISYSELIALIRPRQRLWVINQHKDVVRMANMPNKDIARKLFSCRSDGKIIKKIKISAPELYQRMKRHINKYHWVRTHNFELQPFTMHGLIGEIKEEIYNFSSDEKIDNRARIPENIRQYIEILRMLNFWRSHCAEVSGHTEYYFYPHLKRMGKKLGVAYNELIWFTIPEILSAIEQERILNKEAWEKRQISYGIVYLNKKEQLYTGRELTLLKKRFKKIQTIFKVRLIRGIVASRGRATGRVRLLIELKDVGRLKKGEVLVSPETTPNFIPAMKKASAIVTDIGGLTSHAAIISRELKKPCIIATENATKFLKNGDLVEVDANKGIIKILNHRQNLLKY